MKRPYARPGEAVPSRLLWCRLSSLCLVLAVLPGCRLPLAAAPGPPLRVAVMDPLALQLSCECVGGYAQRRYDKLGDFLEKRLGRPVEIAFTDNLEEVTRVNGVRPDLIIGKQSVILSDASRIGLAVQPLARLSGRDGSSDFCGLFVVRTNDPARNIEGLEGRRILLGPEECEEKHAAAIAALKAGGVTPGSTAVSPGCVTAALAVADGKADAAVLSSYAMPLLEGCGAIERGALRIVGRTGPVPFVAAFLAADSLCPNERERIRAALVSAGKEPGILEALESRDGFVPPHPRWPDWRGPGRDGLSPDVPDSLPSEPTFLWKRPMSGWGLSGIAVQGRFVVVADKSAPPIHDIWRCLDADTGKELWKLRYPAPGEMDYSNSPRANPVISAGRVYLLGAFGHLNCLDLETGKALWSRHLVKDLGGKVPAWGYSSTPLIVDDKLIVCLGGAKASLAALDRFTGALLWTCPGREAAYASFVLAAPGGSRQVVGCDSISLGGWDPETGKRLWEVIPDEAGDFNVPTPSVLGDRVLVATENNGARLYSFGQDRTVKRSPVAAFGALSPDTTSPVVLDGLVVGSSKGELFCLDARDSLKPLWRLKDKAFEDHASLVAGNGHVLALTAGGELFLVKARRGDCRLVSRLRLFAADSAETWSHPALVGGRLYIRTQNSACCLLLREEHRKANDTR